MLTILAGLYILSKINAFMDGLFAQIEPIEK